jgi:hypothetical protein
MKLWCAHGVLEVDESLAQMARPRVHVDAFSAAAAPSTTPRWLSVQRVEQIVGGQVVAGPLGSCVVSLQEDVLQVQVDTGVFPGELVLRVAWYLATTRLGGVLIHASALAEGDQALVACGQSGAGKSTLARLGTAAGARLLTDEIVQVFPDGRVGGTPFRSDGDNVGSPGLVRARYFVTLKHGDHEALEPLEVMEAASVALAQCFDVDAVALGRREVRTRLLAFLDAVERRCLVFRKHADAGRFVRAVLT